MKKIDLQTKTFPACVAELGFTTDVPADWIAHELPNEIPNFSDPTAFVPLAVVTAPHAAIILAFAARPAYDDGTLHEWAWYHLNHNKMQARAAAQDQIGDIPAFVGEAIQQSDMGPMLVRFAFIEDGNRLVNLTLTAPEMLADAVQEVWFAVLRSFRLETPKGSRFSKAGQPEPVAETSVPVESVKPSETQPAQTKASGFAAHALANDAASIDPEHPTNANLRNRGIGFVPNVAAIHNEEKRATLAAAAIEAFFDVPFGWHVTDDGKRTLIFEPSGQVQINLNVIPTEGGSRSDVLDAIQAETEQSYPHPEFMRLNQGNIEALGVRNIHDGDQPLEQYHLLVPWHNDRCYLRARVTSTPERAADACNLAELILNSVSFGGTPAHSHLPSEAHSAA